MTESETQMEANATTAGDEELPSNDNGNDDSGDVTPKRSRKGKKRSRVESEATDVATEADKDASEDADKEEQPTRRRSKRRRTVTKSTVYTVTQKRPRKKKADTKSAKSKGKAKSKAKGTATRKKKATAKKATAAKKRKTRSKRGRRSAKKKQESETDEAAEDTTAAVETETVDKNTNQGSAEDSDGNEKQKEKEDTPPASKKRTRRRSTRSSAAKKTPTPRGRGRGRGRSKKKEESAEPSGKSYVLPYLQTEEDIAEKASEASETEEDTYAKKDDKCDTIRESFQKHTDRIQDWNEGLESLRIDTGDTDSALSGKQLYQKTQELNSVVNTQRNQFETLSTFSEELAQHKSFLFETHADFETAVNNESQAVNGIDTALSALRAQREQQQREFEELYASLCESISSENETLARKCKLTAKLQGLQSHLSKFGAAIEEYTRIDAGYNEYSKSAKEQIPGVENHIESQWQAFKAKWHEWTEEDVFSFLKYELTWFKYEFATDKRTSAKMVKSMAKAGLDGAAMAGDNVTATLLELGIENHEYRVQISDAFKKLAATNPKPTTPSPSAEKQDNDDNDDNDDTASVKSEQGNTKDANTDANTDVDTGKQTGDDDGDEQMTDDKPTEDDVPLEPLPVHTGDTRSGKYVMVGEVAVPQEFVCPLSQQIMREPVLAFDSHVYSRHAILEYLCEHHTSPLTHERVNLDHGREELSQSLVAQSLLAERIQHFKDAHGLN